MRKNFMIAQFYWHRLRLRSAGAGAGQGHPIPSIVQKDGRYALMVDGRPI